MWSFWQRITASDKMFVNYLCHLVVASGLLMALTFGFNSGLADGSTLHAERCVVENLRVEEHYRSNRVTRHVYRPGQKYYVHEVSCVSSTEKARVCACREAIIASCTVATPLILM